MKKISLAAFLRFAVSTFILGSAVPAYSQFIWPPLCQEGSLPSHDPKFPADQLTVICVPPNWNGQLLIYAHGYVAPQAPLQLPIDELTLPDGTFIPNGFFSQGFAFATSSFHKNGVAIEQGANDLNDLLEHITTMLPPGSLQKVYITGGSEGGLIALMLLERFPEKYNAGLALCAPVAGSPDFIKHAYDFRVVFDYFFPNVFTFPPNQPGETRFGAVNVPENAFLFWESDYVPRIIAALKSDLLSTIQLFTVTKAAIDPKDPSSAVETALLLLSYGIFGANDLIATSGGIPYDNRFTTYTGSTNDAALNAGVERVESAKIARDYARQFYQPKGDLQRPLVTLHNLLDPLVPFQHEIKYARLVAQKRKLAFLSLLPVARYGHCDFTSQEIFQAFTLMLLRAGGQALN
jgi:pimeloyl-ACP methyl ester carboxylesterase